MEYLLLNFVFTVLAATTVWFTRKKVGAAVSLKVAIPSGILLALITLVADNLIVGLKIVDYDPAKLSGIRLILAPMEDFGYLVVAVFLVPVIYRWAQAYSKRNQNGGDTDGI